MKKKSTQPSRCYALFWLAILAVQLGVSSCQNQSKEDAEQKADSVALTNPTQAELNSDQSTVLKTILGSQESGIIRGITFGDDIAKIKATETFEMFEETPDSVGYTYDTPQMESIDVQYFLTKEKKVDKIKVEVYLNSKEATNLLWEEGKKHFTEIYASPKETGKALVWNKEAVKVQMENVSAGKDYGLKFTFYSTNKNVLAAR